MATNEPRRRIPEATVARLPGVPADPHRAGATTGVDSISSRGARRAGRRQRRQGAQGPQLPRQLRHARRRLRGRRTSSTRSAASSASTHDWPVVIVGAGNLGQALAGYGGFGERGFPVAGIVDIDAGQGRHGDRRRARPPHRRAAADRAARKRVSIGVVATPAGAAQDAADRLVARRRHEHLELRPGGARGAARRRRCARSTWPSSCRSSATTSSAARPPRRHPLQSVPAGPTRGERVGWTAMSIVVIGVNHRTGPLSVLERLAIAPDDVGQGDRRARRPRQHPRGRRAQHVQPHRGLRRRRAVPRRLRRHPRLPLRARRRSPPTSCTRTSTASTTTPRSRTCSRSPPGSTRPCSARARSSARCARRGRSPSDEGGARADAQPAVPPRARDRQAGPHRDRRSAAARRRSATPRSRWPPSGSARSTAAACSSSAPARWAKASPPRCVDAGAGRHRRRQPHADARRRSSPSASAARSSAFDRLARRARPTPTSSLTCTGVRQSVVDRPSTCSRRTRGRHAPLLIVDIAVPRDVDRAVAELAGVTLLDLDDLRDWADRGIALRAGEADRVRDDRRRGGRAVRASRSTARQAAPLVAQLHERAETIRAGRARALRRPARRARRRRSATRSRR